MKRVCIGALAALVLASCGGDGPGATMQQAEFSSLDRCLAGIKRASRQRINIVSDDMVKVRGTLARGGTFACELTESGTKGVYWVGWFTDS